MKKNEFIPKIRAIEKIANLYQSLFSDKTCRALGFKNKNELEANISRYCDLEIITNKKYKITLKKKYESKK